MGNTWLLLDEGLVWKWSQKNMTLFKNYIFVELRDFHEICLICLGLMKTFVVI